MKIHPILVGVINALLPGAGYVILRERLVFGRLLLTGSLLALALAFVEPVVISSSIFVSKTILGKLIESLWYIFFMLAYGYDAYTLGVEKRKQLLPVII